MKGKKTLEVNPDHPIIAALQARVGEDAEAAKARPARPRTLIGRGAPGAPGLAGSRACSWGIGRNGGLGR